MPKGPRKFLSTSQVAHDDEGMDMDVEYIAHKNPWLAHVAKVRAQNPGIPNSDIMKLASQSYKKQSGGYQKGGVNEEALLALSKYLNKKDFKALCAVDKESYNACISHPQLRKLLQ